MKPLLDAAEPRQLRACRIHPDVFAQAGKCPLCTWVLGQRRRARSGDPVLGRVQLRAVDVLGSVRERLGAYTRDPEA